MAHARPQSHRKKEVYIQTSVTEGPYFCTIFGVCLRFKIFRFTCGTLTPSNQINTATHAQKYLTLRYIAIKMNNSETQF